MGYSVIVTQIVTGLPPKIDGVGDYSFLLAQKLREFGVESRFLVGRSPSTSLPASLDGFAIDVLGSATAEELEKYLLASGCSTVLVQFSGYSYARWGLCWWLVEGLIGWRKLRTDGRLITVFHELYATGPIWQTSFWTSWPQRRIARRLVAASDRMLTTSEIVADHIREWEPQRPLFVLPVFSNVGELAAPRKLSERAPWAVVFGQPARRQRVYERLADMSDVLRDGLQHFGIRRIIDIGPQMPNPDCVSILPVETHGPLNAAQVSAILGNARIGFVDYPLHVFTKSGIVAAYLAHGLLVVNFSSAGSLPRDLREGTHFVHTDRFATSRLDAEAIAAEGYAWYRRHNWNETAAIVHGLVI